MNNQSFIIIVLILLAVAVGAVWVFNINDPMKGVDLIDISEVTEAYEINSQLLNNRKMGATEINAYINEKVEDLKRLAEDHYQSSSSEDDIFHKYTLDIIIEEHNTEDHISYLVLVGEYTGGANVNSSVRAFVYERSNGNTLTLEDLIDEEERQDFVANVRDSLLDPEISRSGVFEDVVETLTFDDLNNFYLESDSITLVFSQYEVAPGSSGIVRVTLPF